MAANAVHPRVCGERVLPEGETATHRGSSPRVRGTVPGADEPCPGGRFIPACAGNGGRKRPPQPRRSVHPRVCGERIILPALPASHDGSSPRVRGTDERAVSADGYRRFIPACAGNGGPRSGGSAGTAVHPRVCGERRKLIGGNVAYIGSSPRVRGTGSRRRPASRRSRFIPACAGNGDGGSRIGPRRAVHPRVCGERATRAPPSRRALGSSPRVRGTARESSPAGRGRRFIPACAGNGARRPARAAAPAVHPRVCGERATWTPSVRVSSGSSPRVRGTASRKAVASAMSRFIPACAGNGSSARTTATRTPVHPRVCGERRGRHVCTTARTGSSPRVRGTD